MADVAHANSLGHLRAPENGKHSFSLYKLDLRLEIICLGVRVILQSFQKMSVFVELNVWQWANLCLLRGQKRDADLLGLELRVFAGFQTALWVQTFELQTS